MSTAATLAVVAVALALVCPLLGRYLAAVFGGGAAPGDRWCEPVERRLYRLIGSGPHQPQRWSAYILSLLAFSGVSVLALYVVLRAQGSLPFNPGGASGMAPSLAFNTAASFVTGTDWQAYAGESAMSHLAQMVALVTTQFAAGAVGLAAAMALVRAIATQSSTIGNFWVDLIRGLVRVLLPMAVVAALLLVAAGTVQSLDGDRTVAGVDGTEQVVPGGPVASQVVAKTMASNGGGFFNANSAHPLDNPNGLTNAIQLWLCLVLPVAILFAFGRMAHSRRHGRVLVAVVAVLWVVPLLVGVVAEAGGNDALPATVDQQASGDQSGGNIEGKEVRFGTGGSTLLTLGSMGTTSGIASSAIGSYTPTGQGTALVPILLGEVSPGGVGSGLIGLLTNVLLATLLAGQMVGRTPTFLGKRLDPRAFKLVVMTTLIVPVVVLVVAAVAVATPSASGATSEAGAQGLSEMLYAAASATNGNGSALGGLNATGGFWTVTLGIAMLAGRFLVLVPALGLAGVLAPQRALAATRGTLDTATPTFGGLVVFVVVIFGGLTYLPALLLTVLAAAL